jgi:gamma-glutamylcyclotransferase (GGCT)/AIG2-like uncharacterized protein YtfP
MSGQFVFGYGSLVRSGGSPARLEGHRRAWQVAMDNSVDLPGYKYYVDAHSGERPALFVTFVDLVPDPRSSVAGVVFPVDDGELEALDSRERNYERRDVTAVVNPPVGGRIWAYFGTAEARKRYERGRSTNTAVVARDYWDAVGGFSGEPAPPIRDLRRIDLDWRNPL